MTDICPAGDEELGRQAVKIVYRLLGAWPEVSCRTRGRSRDDRDACLADGDHAAVDALTGRGEHRPQMLVRSAGRSRSVVGRPAAAVVATTTIGEPHDRSRSSPVADVRLLEEPPLGGEARDGIPALRLRRCLALAVAAWTQVIGLTATGVRAGVRAEPVAPRRARAPRMPTVPLSHGRPQCRGGARTNEAPRGSRGFAIGSAPWPARRTDARAGGRRRHHRGRCRADAHRCDPYQDQDHGTWRTSMQRSERRDEDVAATHFRSRGHRTRPRSTFPLPGRPVVVDAQLHPRPLPRTRTFEPTTVTSAVRSRCPSPQPAVVI